MQPDKKLDAAVLVVGAGPVGLTMAAELARYGVSVRIIDKAAQPTDKSKALVVWSRTLELLDRAGCGEAFIQAGQKVRAASIIAGKQQIAHIKLDTLQTPHPYALMLPQNETERLLAEHLNQYGVQVERQVDLTRFVNDADKVIATLQHANGTAETISVAWMVGCDGAHSIVRHGLGMKFEGNTLLSDWVLADVHLSGGGLNQSEISLYWHADGVLAIFPISPGRYRLIADVGSAEHDKPRPDPTLEEMQMLLDHRGPGGINAASPIWLASFRINERKVADYRAGRVFLAGDAAHIHSPAGGQGMNTGMQDAFNLAWKLAMVHRGAAAESLLDSYSIERSAVGRQVVTDADRLTTVAIFRSGVAQKIRNHVASLLFGLSIVRETMANKLAELSIGYPNSPLTVEGKNIPPVAGQRAVVADVGKSPVFSLFADADGGGVELVDQFKDLLDPEIRKPFSKEGIWLVRPDGYVATLAEAGDWKTIEDYLERVRSGPG